ncbi:hypothetical protein BVX93_01825 [bacterium B13(2017)]|nr:hypothetical protein BVX93_01825 [bacterium B13(2017)]
MKGYNMKSDQKIICLISIIINKKVTFSQKPPDPPKMKYSFNTEEEINQALNEIKAKDENSYTKLVELKKNNDPQFKSRLIGKYFALKRKEMFKKSNVNRKNRYSSRRIHANKKLNDLNKAYKDAKTDEEKTKIKKQIEEEALVVFTAELERRKKQIERTQKLIDQQKKRLETFEKDKDKYIERIVTKTTSI